MKLFNKKSNKLITIKKVFLLIIFSIKHPSNGFNIKLRRIDPKINIKGKITAIIGYIL